MASKNCCGKTMKGKECKKKVKKGNYCHNHINVFTSIPGAKPLNNNVENNDNTFEDDVFEEEIFDVGEILNVPIPTTDTFTTYTFNLDTFKNQQCIDLTQEELNFINDIFIDLTDHNILSKSYKHDSLFDLTQDEIDFISAEDTIACDKDGEPLICPICLDNDLDETEILKPCGHGMHKKCQVGMRDLKCPQCRVVVTNWSDSCSIIKKKNQDKQENINNDGNFARTI